MTEFEVTCKVEKGERNIAYGDDCYCYYTQPNYTERIVRCKDCKHYRSGNRCWKFSYDDGATVVWGAVEPNGFCAWGEQRSDGNARW